MEAYLIGVPHADVALVLPWDVSVDGVDVFRVDQLIHWKVKKHTCAETKDYECH